MDASVRPADTDAEWSRILECCHREVAIGLGLLDSFLSGEDLDRRVELVVVEAETNEWLRLELRDTLTLNQSADWSGPQHAALSRAVEGLPGSGC